MNGYYHYTPYEVETLKLARWIEGEELGSRKLATFDCEIVWVHYVSSEANMFINGKEFTGDGKCYSDRLYGSHLIQRVKNAAEWAEEWCIKPEHSPVLEIVVTAQKVRVPKVRVTPQSYEKPYGNDPAIYLGWLDDRFFRGDPEALLHEDGLRLKAEISLPITIWSSAQPCDPEVAMAYFLEAHPCPVFDHSEVPK